MGFYEGKDALGEQVSPPSGLNKLRELFSLHIDIVDVNNLPPPTYKRTPIGEQLSQEAGFSLETMDLIVKDQLQSNMRHLCEADLFDNPKVAYFGAGESQRRVTISDSGPATLDCGWPDGVGIYRHGRGVLGELLHWGSHQE